MEIDTERIKTIALGVDVRIAQKNLKAIYPELNPLIEYRESDRAKYSTLGFKFNKYTDKFTFIVASDCPIVNLPMIYQENEFLRRFMMIFQTFFNQTDFLMRNVDMYFRPSEAPKQFLPTLISWLGVNLRLLQGDEKLIRKVLQYAIPLFKIRGTNKGLKLFLYLISGVMPEIIEGSSSFKSFNMLKETDIDTAMFTEADVSNSFYVYFSCLESDLSRVVVETIHNIVQSEKPSFTQGFVIFKKPAAQRRKVTTYEDVDVSFTSEEPEAEKVASSTDSERARRKRKHSEKKPAEGEKSTKSKKTDFDDSIVDF